MILLFLEVFFFSLNNIRESDVLYHVKTGEIIWETKSVPKTDQFSYTAYGKTWVTHEWLSEVMFYGLQHVFGWWGIIVFASLVAVLAYGCVFQTARVMGANAIVATLVIIGLSFFIRRVWVPRPHIIAFVLLSVLMYLLAKYEKERNQSLLWWIVPLVWLWANISATVIFGIVVIAWWGLVKWWQSRNQNIQCNHIGAVVVSAFGASLLNPNTYHTLLYAETVKQATRIFGVDEWRSMLAFLSLGYIKVFVLIYLVSTVWLLWRFCVNKKTRNLVLGGVIAGVALLPLVSIRHMPLWVVIVAAPLAVALSEKSKKYLEAGREKWVMVGSVVMMLVGMGVSIFGLPRLPMDEKKFPVNAVNFIEKNGIKGPLFNLYNEGGYLIWRLWPKEKVFIDGRSEIFGEDVQKDFFIILQGLNSWEKIVEEKYNMNYFILGYWPYSLMQSIEPLVRKLEIHWSLVYWDDAALVFVKNTPMNERVIEKYALRHIHPYRNPKTIKEEEYEAAKKEIESLRMRSPDSILIKEYARQFESSHVNR